MPEEAPENDNLRIFNQDLAGFGPARMRMTTKSSLFIQERPTTFNSPGDLVKGCEFRRLSITRKIAVQDVPDLIKQCNLFALGPRSLRQRRGSPMGSTGSPLSEALCLMVVSISEQIWPINFKEILANHNLFVRHLRYVDNRLILGNHPI